MKNATIITATLALVLTMAFASSTAASAPYVKGSAPQIQNENSASPASVNHDSTSAGVAFTSRASLGVENGSGAATLASERPAAKTASDTTGKTTSSAVKTDRPNYGIENGTGAHS